MSDIVAGVPALPGSPPKRHPQNYHLARHLHTWLPSCRYLQVWRRNETTYLGHDPAITMVFGTELSADECRQLRHGR